MDTRADFQRLLEDMDKVIQRKRQELSELDERLETARTQLSEKEAQELRDVSEDNVAGGPSTSVQQVNEYLQEQRTVFEQQLLQQAEEISELESINQELGKENEDLKYEVGSLRASNEKFRAKAHILVESLEEVKSANFELNMQLARAESESQMQQKLLKKLHDQDQVLMDAFNDKLETLKEAIASRDEEIERLRLDSQVTLESLGIKLDATKEIVEDDPLVSSDNKQRVIDIANAFREKDSQIQLLKSQLSEATKDLEKNASIIENLSKHRINGFSFNMDEPDGYENNSDKQKLETKCQMLEDELETKDKQLYSVEYRNQQLETVLPNQIIDIINRLSRIDSEEDIDTIKQFSEVMHKFLLRVNESQSLLDELEQYRRSNETKSAQIEQLVRELNQLDAKLNGETIIEEPKAESPLENNNTEVKDDSDDKKNKVEEKQQEKPIIPKQAPTSSILRRRGLRKSTDRSKSINFKQTTTFEQALGVQSRLKQLENENQLLELAMKEILLSIKWSDAKCSTILIDCPSLERLCQLIEARFLASGENNENLNSPRSKSQMLNVNELFQFIVMKSELDLLRGQNEQLRVDMKRQRLEFNEFLLRSPIRSEEQSKPREVNTEAFSKDCLEVECQTDTLAGEKCNNCKRLINLANHLLQCIVRIETKMNVTDETCMSRMISLYRLTQRLGKDLAIHENLLSESRREYHVLAQKKMATESRLQLMEQQMNSHLKNCPMSTSLSQLPVTIAQTPISLKPDEDRQMTITLLKSIMSCLQARLNYKDERLQQLEQLLARASVNEVIDTN